VFRRLVLALKEFIGFVSLVGLCIIERLHKVDKVTHPGMVRNVQWH